MIESILSVDRWLFIVMLIIVQLSYILKISWESQLKYKFQEKSHDEKHRFFFIYSTISTFQYLLKLGLSQ